MRVPCDGIEVVVSGLGGGAVAQLVDERVDRSAEHRERASERVRVRAPTLTLSAAEIALRSTTTIRARRTPVETHRVWRAATAMVPGGVSIRRIVRSLYERCQRSGDSPVNLVSHA